MRSDVDAYKQKMAELERVNESIVEQLRAAGSSSAPPDLSEGSPLHEELARLRETLETERAEAAAKQQSMRRSLHDYKVRLFRTALHRRLQLTHVRRVEATRSWPPMPTR